MECMNMLNPDHHNAVPMSPRISFSNDFAVNDPPVPVAAHGERFPVDPNFEFSVGSRPMMAADELFFKGRMLPLRGGEGSSGGRLTTLREELREEFDASTRPPKAASASFFKFMGRKKQTTITKNNPTTSWYRFKGLHAEGGAKSSGSWRRRRRN